MAILRRAANRPRNLSILAILSYGDQYGLFGLRKSGQLQRIVNPDLIQGHYNFTVTRPCANYKKNTPASMFDQLAVRPAVASK